MSTPTQNREHYDGCWRVARILEKLNRSWGKEGTDSGLVFEAVDLLLEGKKTSGIERKILAELKKVVMENAKLIGLSQSREDALDIPEHTDFAAGRCIDFLLMSKNRNWSPHFVAELTELKTQLKQQTEEAKQKAKQLPPESAASA